LLLPNKKNYIEESPIAKKANRLSPQECVEQSLYWSPGKVEFVGLKYQVPWREGLKGTHHRWDMSRTPERDKSDFYHSCHRLDLESQVIQSANQIEK